jgi:hypothetical protein
MAADEQVIQGILQQIETAWNRYDSVSFAATFAEDANFIQKCVRRARASRS